MRFVSSIGQRGGNQTPVFGYLPTPGGRRIGGEHHGMHAELAKTNLEFVGGLHTGRVLPNSSSQVRLEPVDVPSAR
jgi:hypothetical protein